MPLGIEIGEAVACLSGALLAEGVRPGENWRATTVNVLLGMAFGAFGPQGLEMWWMRFEKAHRLTTFLCALSGSIICRKLLDWLAGKKLAEIVDAVVRLRKIGSKDEGSK